MTYYYEGQKRFLEFSTDGRMSVSEIVSLLSHLNSEQYERPWIDTFEYVYDENTNKTNLALVVTRDRPHPNAQYGKMDAVSAYPPELTNDHPNP